MVNACCNDAKIAGGCEHAEPADEARCEEIGRRLMPRQEEPGQWTGGGKQQHAVAADAPMRTHSVHSATCAPQIFVCGGSPAVDVVR